MFSPLQSATDEKTVEEVPLQQSSHHENMTIRAPQLSITASKCSHHYASLSAFFSQLHSITNEEQCYNRLCNQSSNHRKNGRLLFTNVL